MLFLLSFSVIEVPLLAFTAPILFSHSTCTHMHLTTDETISDGHAKKLKVVVVGGGWAGYSFCESISHNNNVEINLLDAFIKGTGGLAGGYRSKNDRPVEGGIHGFWREYRNTFDIMSMIENVEVDKVLGKFSPSVLRSKNGKVAVAPVLLKENEDGGYRNEVKIPTLMDFSEESIRRLIAANLPPPLDLPVLAKLDNSKTNGDDNSKLNPIDLLSGLGLLGAQTLNKSRVHRGKITTHNLHLCSLKRLGLPMHYTKS